MSEKYSFEENSVFDQMTKTESFNHQLNHSDSLGWRWRMFESYRDQLTRFLCDAIQRTDDLFVFAAGNLADIDYKQMIESCQIKEVILSDVDGISLQEGIEQQNIQAIIRMINYLGKDSDVTIQGFVKELRDKEKSYNNQGIVPDALEIQHAMEALFEAIVTDMEQIPVHKTFETVLVLPVYTQLLFFQLEVMLKDSYLWHEFRTTFFENMTKVIEAFNRLVLKHSRPSGNIIVVSDLIQIPSMEAVFETMDVIRGSFGNNSDTQDLQVQQMEGYVEQYESTYGMGLGSYGVYEMEQHSSLKYYTFLPWQFAEDTLFLVKVCFFSNDTTK